MKTSTEVFTSPVNKLGFTFLLFLTATLALECDDVHKCFQRPILDEIVEAFGTENENFRFKFNSTQLDIMCNEWKEAKSCYDREMRWCYDDEQKAKYQAIRNVVHYVCNKGYDSYVKHSSCYTSDDVENRMKSCENRITPQIDDEIERVKKGEIDQIEFQREFCRLTFGMVECFWRIVEEDCGKEAMEAQRNLTNQILEPVYIRLKCYEAEGCMTTTYGSTYDGKTTFTNTGKTCQRWDSQYPHKHSNTDPSKFPEDTLEDAANYCRNPDLEDDGPWCYTTDPDSRWETCAVRRCSNIISKPSKGLSTGTILGIVSGCLSGLSGLCFLCAFCLKHCCCQEEEQYPEVDEHPQQLTALDADKEKGGQSETTDGPTETTWSRPEDYKPQYAGQNGLTSEDSKI